MNGAFLRRVRSVLSIVLLSCTGALPAGAQEVDVPADLQVTLLARIMTFDRTLMQDAESELVIGVVHQPGYPASRDFQREIIDAWSRSGMKAGTLPVRVVPVELTRPDRLAAALRAQKVDVALIAPLRAIDVDAVFEAARAAGARTAGSVAEYVERGCSVGFAVERGRPRIRINLRAARAEGSDFGSELLALAEVVR